MGEGSHVQEGVKACPKCGGSMSIIAQGRSILYRCSNCGYEEQFEV